jgi:hypothetical protein
MAHYAFLDENNVVTEVITGNDENDLSEGVADWEEWYGNFRGQVCKRTSYNTYREIIWVDVETNPRGFVLGESRHYGGGTPFRGQYAQVGDIYDAQLDEFITPESGAPQ